MPFYKSALNIFEVVELQVGENPRNYSDFLIEIGEEEFRNLQSRRTPRAADVCQTCGTIDEFENIMAGGKVCRVCGTHR